MAGKWAPIFKITSAAEIKEEGGMSRPHLQALISEKSLPMAVPGLSRQRQFTVNGAIILIWKKLKLYRLND